MRSLVLALLVLSAATLPLSPRGVENGLGDVPAVYVDRRPDASISKRGTGVARSADPVGQLASVFEENAGQAESQVEYLVRGTDSTVFFTRRTAVIAFHGASCESSAEPCASGLERARSKALQFASPQTSIALSFDDSSSRTIVRGENPVARNISYLDGNRSLRVQTYASLRRSEVYRGIDAVYYFRDGELEFDLIVAPGIDPRSIKMRFGGARSVAIDLRGALLVCAGDHSLRLDPPNAYQRSPQGNIPVSCRYVRTSDGSVAYSLDGYDSTEPLVIDPVINFSTVLARSAATDTTVGADGSIYVVGTTYSASFPATHAIQGSHGGGFDAYIAKLAADGKSLVYASYLGGSRDDFGRTIAVDESGAVYVSGTTESENFPTRRPLQPQHASSGSNDGFVAKVTPAGDGLEFSSYLGGTNIDSMYDIAVDSSHATYLTGYTYSSDFPTFNAYQSTFGGGSADAFITKISPSGEALVYTTFLGGDGDDIGRGLAVRADNSVVVGGVTASSNFPTVSPIQPSLAGGADAFVSILAASGESLVTSTYLGGGTTDDVSAIALDSHACPIVAGYTTSFDFPTTPGALQPIIGDPSFGYGDAFVSKLNPTATALVASTYLGGSQHEYAYALVISAADDVFLTGETRSSDFPVTSDAFQPEHSPDAIGTGPYGDALVTVLNPDLDGLVYSSYLGGQGVDIGYGIAVDVNAAAVVVGVTQARDFPILRSLPARTPRDVPNSFITSISPIRPVVRTATYNGSKGEIKIVSAYALSADVGLEINGLILGPPATLRVNAGKGVVKARGTADQLHIDSGVSNAGVLIVSGVRSAEFSIAVAP